VVSAELRTCLTRDRFEDHGPIFASVKELAEKIANLPGDHRFAGKAKSAESALNAIFRAERPYTEEVQSLLRQAVQLAIEDWHQSSAALAQLTFERHRARKPYDTKGENTFEDFLDSFGRAPEVLVILGEDSQDYAALDSTYRDALVEKLGLSIPNEQASELTDQDLRALGRMSFICSTQEDAKILWDWLLSLRFTRLTADEPDESNGFTAVECIDRFRALERAGVVRVFLVSSCCCLIPAHILNPFSLDLCEGWIHYESDSGESVAHVMPGNMSENFRNLIWHDLEAGSLEGQRQVTLADLGEGLEAEMIATMRHKRHFLNMVRLAKENKQLERDPNSGVRHKWRLSSKKKRQ